MKNISIRLLLSCLLFLLSSCTQDKLADSFNKCKAEFAYVGLDGNIYLSDMCGSSTIQVTHDAKSEGKEDYLLVHDGWNIDGEDILALNKDIAYLINVTQIKTSEIGPAEDAKWSPTGLYIMLTGKDSFTVYKRDSLDNIFQLLGYAPSWVDDKRILFALKDYEGNIPRIYSLSIVDIFNGNTVKAGELSTSGGKPIHSSVSYDGHYAYFFSPLGEFSRNLVIVDLLAKTTIENSYIHLNFPTSVAWTPNEDKLILCYGYINLFAPDVGDEFSPFTNQPCWSGTRISWDSNGTRFSYLVPDGRNIIVADSNSPNIENTISWIDDSPSGLLDGPYLAPDGSHVSILFENQIRIFSLTGANVFLTDGIDFEWKP